MNAMNFPFRWLSLVALLAAAPASAAPVSADANTPEWRYTVRPDDSLGGTLSGQAGRLVQGATAQSHCQSASPDAGQCFAYPACLAAP